MKSPKNSSIRQTCLGVFGKYWQPGKVKTRLASRIGDQSASSVYLAFLRTILKRFAQVADHRVLAYSPSNRKREFAALGGECWELVPQVADDCRAEPDLGQRMKDFFDLRFRQGNGRVVLIGSDAPTVPLDFVEQAFAALAEQQAVVGPAEDGGYYLVGMSQFEPRIFDNIQWSTRHVFEQTIARFRELNLSYSALPEGNDVDDLQDLLRLRKELRDARPPDAHCARLLAELDGLLKELPL